MSSDARHCEVAIAVRGLGKAYTIRHKVAAPTTLAEAIVGRLRHPLRGAAQRETFWALKDVSLDVHRGDVVGVIGRNGAGKSTLLKILSRITEPTAGEVDLYGRVGSLLEVGTGFHQELTGRENIFLNGAILGMTRGEIRRQFDAIVDFAGVDKFLDTPVKRYSSGMYVRLAFAVAAHLSCDIMLVDEVLAVGDAQFQQKCLGKMKEVASAGRTVLFVSHNMHSIATLCSQAMLLSEGRLVTFGPTGAAISAYAESVAGQTETIESSDRRRGSGEYRFAEVRPAKASFQSDEEKSFRFRIERRRGRQTGGFFIGAHVLDALGQILFQCDSRMVSEWLQDAPGYEGVLRLRTPWLKPGDYRLDLYLAAGGLVDVFEHACPFSVTGGLPYERAAAPDATERGAVFADFEFQFRESHDRETPLTREPLKTDLTPR
jgi:lipopolysaccharide transport system ATP-binding protein